MGFMDSAGKGVKFEKVGDSIRLTVKRVEFDVATKNLKNEDVTEDRVHGVDGDGEDRTLYVNKYALAKAIREAVIGAGKTSLDPGDELVVLHHDTQAASKPGFSPQKLFQAKVTPGNGQAPGVAEMVAGPAGGVPASVPSIDDL